jgi:transglutaminase-like putative cysteine protease
MLLAATLAHGPAFAKNDQVERGPAPRWVKTSDPLPVPAEASGLVFVRNQDIQVHLDEQGQLHYTGYRIKILHANALQAGNLSIAWDPASGAAVVHSIKVHRGSEVIDALNDTIFEILRREDQLEAAMLDGTLTAVARIADLRVGDELEFAHTVRFKDPTVGNKDAGLLYLPPVTPPGRYRMGLSWDEGQQPTIKMTDDLTPVAQKDERAVEIRFDNPVNLTPANDAPPRFYWQRIVEFSDYPQWSEISRRFAPLYDKASNLSASSSIKKEASRIAAAHVAALDRATAALKLVQQDVRYIYVGLDGGNLTPATADETWQRRYGDCKGKTVLLLALLAELGIEAEPVLANNAGNDDGLNERLPNPQMFDHVLVRARIDGKVYYLDGTLPPVAQPSPAPTLPYRWILPLTAEGSDIERLEWRPPNVPDEVTLFEIDARAGFDQPARISRTTIVRGIDGLRQQVQFSSVTPAELLSGMRQQAIGDTWQTIEEAKWKYDQKAQASVLTISGTGKVDWDDDGEGARSIALPGGGFSPPNKRLRAADQDQNLPYFNKSEYSCFVTTVRIPSNTKIDHWASKSGFSTNLFGRNYYRAFSFKDGSVRMVRGSRVEQQEIDAVIAKRDNERIASFDNSMGYIFYDPTSQNYETESDTKVPATFEIDWTGETVPCLASSMKK